MHLELSGIHALIISMPIFSSMYFFFNFRLDLLLCPLNIVKERFSAALRRCCNRFHALANRIASDFKFTEGGQTCFFDQLHARRVIHVIQPMNMNTINGK